MSSSPWSSMATSGTGGDADERKFDKESNILQLLAMGVRPGGNVLAAATSGRAAAATAAAGMPRNLLSSIDRDFILGVGVGGSGSDPVAELLRGAGGGGGGMLSSPALQPRRRGSSSVSSYKDFSTVPAPPAEVEPWIGSDAQVRPPFPAKLYNILSHPEHEHIISWMPHGRAWKILDADKFATQVLPLYFEFGQSYRHCFHTFLRLVRIWGFRQITKGADVSAYYSEVFLRGMPHLHRVMRPDAGAARSALDDGENEPNLYDFPAMAAGASSKKQRPSTSASPALAPPALAPRSGLIFPMMNRRQPVDERAAALQAFNAAAGASQSKVLLEPSESSPVAAAQAAAAQAAAAQQAAVQQQQQQTPPVSSQYLFRNPTSRRTEIDATQMLVENELRAAQDLHDLSIKHLRAARRIADGEAAAAAAASASAAKATENAAAAAAVVSSATLLSPRATNPLSLPMLSNGRGGGGIPVTPTIPLTPRPSSKVPAVTPDVRNANANSAKKTPKTPKTPNTPKTPKTPKTPSSSTPNKKKNKRKWLPPLGPPSVKPRTPGSSSSASTATTAGLNNYDWLYTNPEVFASLSNPDK